MRRSIILTTVLAVSTAVLGACETPKPEVPNKPATPAPTATAAPATPAPTGSPVTTPVKPGTTPEVKKTDDKNVNKEVKPAATSTPKTS